MLNPMNLTKKNDKKLVIDLSLNLFEVLFE